jgi:hypothetical protein
MPATTRRGPKPFDLHQLSTIFVRVPTDQWGAIRSGRKTEFRTRAGNRATLAGIDTPLPCVAYRLDRYRIYDAEMMVLEAVWREPLMAISAESLAAEGFASFAEFRQAWIIKEKRWFRPLDVVTAYRLRPWTPEDGAGMGDALLRRLYSEFLPHDASEPVAVRVVA